MVHHTVDKVDRAIWAEARRLFGRYAQLVLPPWGCLSFAVMRRLGFREVVTFDRGFEKAGFIVVRSA